MRDHIFYHKCWYGHYLVDMKIQLVPVDKAHPEGIRYSLVLIFEGKRILGYDNYEGKGHHIHRRDREFPYSFVDQWRVIEDFMNEAYHVSRGQVK